MPQHIFRILVCILLVFLSTEGESAPLNVQEILRKVSPSVFKVLTVRGTGSGFVVSRRGLGVTSLHVVENTGQLRIQFHGNKEQTTKVVARYPDLDLAVLSFDAGGIRSLPLGDSLKIAAGDKVVAIGYPLKAGLSVTPTEISSIESYRGLPLIYVDTLVPPGSSGGPLVNDQGQVVGITFRKKQLSDQNGKTLALPINEARKKLAKLLDRNRQ